MPFNPQTKVQSNIFSEILAKFVKQEPQDSNNQDSISENPNQQIAEGKWEDDQNLKFTVFIDYHSKIFSSKQKRKSEKIFKILSNHLGNRTPAQCRSHYQKVIIKFKTIAKLKKHFKEYFGEELYNKNYRQFVEHWKETHPQENQTQGTIEKKELIDCSAQTEPLPTFQEQLQQYFQMWHMTPWFHSFHPNLQYDWKLEGEPKH